MSDLQQLPLFDEEPGSTKPDQPPTGAGQLDPSSSLNDALEVYLEAIQQGGFSLYTVKAFKSDLNLLGNWGGHKRAIGTFATEDLNKFLHWMLNERSRPCSPKTYARRITTLKSFFGYLHEQGAISKNPSTALIQESVSSPLPEVLLDAETERVLKVTRHLHHNAEKPDARPHLLVTLLLQTGIKKGECMSLRLMDIDRSDPSVPFLWVRYASPRMRYKERKIDLEPDWLSVLDEYMLQRNPPDKIFDCTARNLEYVLRDIATAAGVDRRKVTFEALRWTCALTDYRKGMDLDKLRQKLGLSRISWRETSDKLRRLEDQFGMQSQ